MAFFAAFGLALVDFPAVFFTGAVFDRAVVFLEDVVFFTETVFFFAVAAFFTDFTRDDEVFDVFFPADFTALLTI